MLNYSILIRLFWLFYTTPCLLIKNLIFFPKLLDCHCSLMPPLTQPKKKKIANYSIAQKYLILPWLVTEKMRENNRFKPKKNQNSKKKIVLFCSKLNNFTNLSMIQLINFISTPKDRVQVYSKFSRQPNRSELTVLQKNIKRKAKAKIK